MTARKLTHIARSALERQVALSLAGMRAGSNIIGSDALNWWMTRDRRETEHRRVLEREARRFVDEIGKLKGGYVKIGQTLAVLGETLLPPELTDALGRLGHETTPLEWSALEPVLREELGERVAELDVDTEALAAASLGQVHRARVRRTARDIVLKIQYPDIAGTIDADFDYFVRLLRVTRWLERGAGLDELAAAAHTLLREELDYRREARMTRRMRRLLTKDARYRVPRVLDRYSTARVLALDHMEGLQVTDERIRALPLDRRNRIAMSMLDLLLTEIFRWGILQTDPNFGNYRIDPSDPRDRLTLLDFGAVRELEPALIVPLRDVIAASHADDLYAAIDGLTRLGCILDEQPPAIQETIARVCMGFLEPLAPSFEGVPSEAVTPAGDYRWAQSDLIRRAGKRAIESAVSPWFRLPPRDFALVTRKLSGVFSFIAALNAEFRGYPLIERQLRRWRSRRGAK